jgi:uncharacterized repeat protein (TIGR03803 family)
MRAKRNSFRGPLGGIALALAGSMAHAQMPRTVYSFAGAADGRYPLGTPVVVLPILTATASSSAGAGQGSVVQMNLATSQLTVLHEFAGGSSDGYFPNAGVIADPSGDYYGTTVQGGAANRGIIYEIDRAGVFHLLHSFTGGADGGSPYGALVRDSSGNLYGTTTQGGATPSSDGTVFKYDTGGNLTALLNFRGTNGGGALAGLILHQGKLYGVTSYGGTASPSYGTVFELAPASGKQTILYRFSGGADGANPQCVLVADSSGNLYGTAPLGGNAFDGQGNGVVFQLNIASRQYTVLHTFTGPDGAYPVNGLLTASTGVFYGTTQAGGTSSPYTSQGGTVFEIDSSGTFTMLAEFSGFDGFGAAPSGLASDAKGFLYGVTEYDGASENGTIFKLKP